MSEEAAAQASVEVWAGVECTVNRVGDTWSDQLVRSGHDSRPDDLERIAALGVRAVRYPALWERLAPDRPDDIDWRWTDARLRRLRELGLRPILGLLHHGSGPRYTSLVHERFPEQLAAFAAAVARRYPWVSDYTPVNEPLTTARFSGLYGHWYPHRRDAPAFVRALLTQMRGVVLAMRAIRAETPGAALIQTEDCGRTFGTPATGRQVAHEEHRRWLTWDLLNGRVTREHPLWDWLIGSGASPQELAFFSDAPCPPDVVGLNYYLTSDRYLDERLERYPAHQHGGNGELAYADVDAVRARDEGIVGHATHLIEAWQRYRTPVAFTEVHLACSREEQVRWLMESWHGAHRARAAGADVKAITAWALFGSFDWCSLVTRDDGRYEPGVFDLRAPVPRPTALATAVRGLALDGDYTHPVLAVDGWWRRPGRLVFRAATPAPPPRCGRPVVVVGASPDVADVFDALCEVRGLGRRLVSRLDYDFGSPAAADAMLRALTPWAVIDMTAGHPGPRSIASAQPLSHTEHVNLAAACRRRGISLVYWSSSLVFDGGQAPAYSEDDAAQPSSAQGAILADIERRVRDVLPEALVIRTGPLFTAADDWVTDALGTQPAPMAAARSGRLTYVPHALDVMLDLLIDAEQGVWHLVNEDAGAAPDAATGGDGQSSCLDAAAPVALHSVRGWLMPGLARAVAEAATARPAKLQAVHIDRLG